jgi:DNA-directed RNA polymerase omega subunit
MIYPSGDELEKKVGSKFALVMAVSKRAKQLKDGSPPQIETRSTNPITIALEEIAAGKLTITIPTQEQMDLAERLEGVPKTAAREAADLLRLAAEEEVAVEGIEEVGEPVPAGVEETTVAAVEEAPAAEAKPKKTRKKAEVPEETEVVEAVEAAPEAVEESPAAEAKPKKTRKKAERKAEVAEAVEAAPETVEVTPATEAKPKKTRKKAEPKAEEEAAKGVE